jgi:uncharacterized protein YggE
MKSMMRAAMVVALVVAMAGVAGCGTTKIVTTADQSALNTVTTSGEGKALVAPDQAEMSFGVAAEGANAKTVFADASKKADKIIAALKKAGVAAEDIQTSGVNLSPQWEYRNGDSIPKGYSASIDVRATIKEIANTGDVITAAVDAGAKNIGGPSFTLSEKSGSRIQAIEKAVADARARAEAMAKAAGKSVGEVLSISETGVTIPPIYYGDSFSAKDALLRAAVPIEPGTLDITAGVTVVFELK